MVPHVLLVDGEHGQQHVEQVTCGAGGQVNDARSQGDFNEG